MNSELYQKRTDLILDYIAQILVYGSNTNGILSFESQKFTDGKYIILAVSVPKNNYFRFHDLGIQYIESKKFYDFVFQQIVEKFKQFNLFIIDNSLIIESDINHNQIKIIFSLNKKIDKAWFDMVSKKFL